MMVDQRKNIYVLVVRRPSQRIQACHGLPDAAAAGEVEGRALGSGQGHTGDAGGLAGSDEIVAGDDPRGSSVVGPDELDRLGVVDILGAVQTRRSGTGDHGLAP